MENLDVALTGKKLGDLETEVVSGGSNPIEPTVTEIESILTALKDGLSYSEIKKTVRRWEKDGEVMSDEEIAEALVAAKSERTAQKISAKGFSYGQIKEIDLARQAKIAELTPKDLEAEV